MDPFTHTLVGASLAATRLGERTQLATPALVLGANLPDVDVLSYVRGDDFALGFRRGWTHGVPAMVVLPALLALALLLWNAWRGDGESERPLSKKWLFGLSYLACLTHPFLDWLNTYGMRWWMPFRDTWTYGDSVFIIDPWLWLLLGLGWLIGRRATRLSGVVAIVIAALAVGLVASAATAYFPVIAGVALALLLALFWKPWPVWLSAQRAAAVGLASGALYIGSMIVLHGITVDRARLELEQIGFGRIRELMAGPLPANPLAWDIVVDTGSSYRWGRFDWRHSSLVMSGAELPTAKTSELWDGLVASGQAPGFLTWTRFPWLEIEEQPERQRVYLLDARYARGPTTGFGGTMFELEAR